MRGGRGSGLPSLWQRRERGGEALRAVGLHRVEKLRTEIEGGG